MFIPAWGGEGGKKKNSWSVKLEASSQQVTCWRMNKCPLIYREGFSDDVMDTFRVFFVRVRKKTGKKVMKSDSVIRTDSWSSSRMVIIKIMC